MYINEYFKTPVWMEEKPEFVKSLNKASDKYIKAAKKTPVVKKYLKQFGDFGISHHSTPLTQDNDFLDLRNYIGQKSWEFLDHHGYDMKQYQTMFSEMWVQEFSKKGGGHHSAHVHWNQHVSGFYFLKCSDKTSYPIFHEPRTGARTTKLKMKNQDQRVDLPTIGPKTIEMAQKTGIRGIALEAQGSLILEQACTIKKANFLKIFIVGIKIEQVVR